jgi:hypothetical protein
MTGRRQNPDPYLTLVCELQLATRNQKLLNLPEGLDS